MIAAQHISSVYEAEADGRRQQRQCHENRPEYIVAPRMQQDERVEVEQRERQATQEEHQREQKERERVEQCGRAAAESRGLELLAHFPVVVLLLNARLREARLRRFARFRRAQTARHAERYAAVARARRHHCGATGARGCRPAERREVHCRQRRLKRRIHH